MERRYTTSDAAAIIGISPKTLRNMISKQRLGRPTKHTNLAYEYIGNRTVFRESVLQAWIEAEHQLGLRKYKRRRALTNSDTDPRYVKPEDWDGKGHRCEHCGLVRSWNYQLKNHLAYRERHGHCPQPESLRAEQARAARRQEKKKRGRPKGSKNRRKRKPRAPARDSTPGREVPPEETLYRCAHCKQVFADEKELDRHLKRRKRLGYCKKPKPKPKPASKRKAKPKKRPKRPGNWKKKPLSVVEGWDDDEYIGT